MASRVSRWKVLEWQEWAEWALSSEGSGQKGRTDHGLNKRNEQKVCEWKERKVENGYFGETEFIGCWHQFWSFMDLRYPGIIIGVKVMRTSDSFPESYFLLMTTDSILCHFKSISIMFQVDNFSLELYILPDVSFSCLQWEIKWGR